MAERSEILSEAEVDFLLSAEAQDAPLQQVENQAVTMRGDLEQIQLADVFQTLAMTKMEGVLRIRNPLEERQAHCRDGYLRLHVPGRVLARRLGQRLVNAGLCSPEALRSALLQQRKDRRPLGQLLVETGVVGQDVVDEIVADQVAEDMFALFTWRHGSFEFWRGEPQGELRDLLDACPEYEINSLLLEVARRSDEWNTILTTIGSLDEVPARIAELPEEGSIGELHLEILRAVDGNASYRELADRTTAGLFDAARAARDLVRMRLVANIAEPAMVTVAQRFAESGNAKRAVMTLQTLRDRPGDRPVGVLQGMATCLQSFGERKLASQLLLEAAQRHSDGDAALALARAARKLEPHDVGCLSFLRTILIAHAPSDSPELEQCTTDLLDSLIAADKVSVALDIIEDARRTNTLRPAILLREARARQKSRDLAGATTVLEELARLHEERGELALANEAYEALLRLDRSRRDIQKLLLVRRRSKAARILRGTAIAATGALVAGLGFALYSHHAHLADLDAARAEISALVAKEDGAGATSSLSTWMERLGPCETIDDLSTQVAYVRSLQQARLVRQKRLETSKRLAQAAESLAKGELDVALGEYRAIAADPMMRAEANDVAATRLLALANDIEHAAKAVQSRTLPAAKSLLDRRELLQASAELDTLCPPQLRKAAAQLATALTDPANGPILTAELQQRLTAAETESRNAFAGATSLAKDYAAALAKNDQQRRLDPLFQRAVEREAANDFRAALQHYRELEQHSQDDAAMREHFRDRVARNATIVQYLDLLATATAAGDHATALQHLRALRTTFPDVPFDRFVRLPLRIETLPAGASVRCNGKEVGVTPLLVERTPGATMAIELALAGFQPQREQLTGDEPAQLVGELAYQPRETRKHGTAIDQPPCPLPNGHLVVDRAGTLTLVGRDGTPAWVQRTGDLSGCLTAPLLLDQLVVVGSVDGELRAFGLADGAPRWSVADCPMELAPQRLGDDLVVATTDGRLLVIGLDGAIRRSLVAPAKTVAFLAASNGAIVHLGADGGLQKIDPSRENAAPLPSGLRGLMHATIAGDAVYAIDEDGTLLCIGRNGAERWRRELQGEPIGAPFVNGDDVWQTLRHGIVKLQGKADPVAQTIPSAEGEHVGALCGAGPRIVVPAATGLDVHDAATGARLYRLAASKRARCLAAGSEVWVQEPDHVIAVFRDFR